MTRLRKYTVLLLYPDYIADAFGHETYFAHVTADSPADAVEEARADAVASNPSAESDDFHPLLVIRGHQRDLTP